jgi:hypothetical protein
VVGDRIIAYAGKLLVHTVRALLVCWQRMLRLGLSVGTLSGLVALVFGAFVTHTIPPAPLTWVVALFFGFALGYAAAMTVLADEMLLGIFDAIRVLEGDVRAGLRVAAVALEREAGEAGRGVMRFLGRARPTPEEAPPPAPRRGVPPSQSPMTVSSMDRHEPGQDQAAETLAAVAATESFISTAPRPAVNARPVRADQLPRIGWASDEAEMQRARAAGIVAIGDTLAPSLAEMPPLPIRTLRSQPHVESPVAAAPYAIPPATAAPAQDNAATQPAGTEESVREPFVQTSLSAFSHDIDSRDAVWSGATPAVQGGTNAAGDVPTMIPSDAVAGGDWASEGPAPSDTPATADAMSAHTDSPPATTRPLATIAQPIEEGRGSGLWARISQALIGNTTVPLRDVDTAGNPGGGSEASQP